MEIKGRYTTAIVYASIIEDEAIEQIRAMCDQPFTEDSRVRIMPDVHAGKGCTVGTTMTVMDKAVPNIVGVDIGCGMYTIRLREREIDFARLDEAAHYVPSGMNVWNSPREQFDLTSLRCYHRLKHVDRLHASLGTLGGGNHFIEVDRAKDGTLYLIIHTGSRNLGQQVANYYQSAAVDLHYHKTAEFAQRRQELISTYSADGRQAELQNALKALEQEQAAVTCNIPEALCYVYGDAFEDYLHDVEICQRYALRNRELIAEILMEHAGLTAEEAFHTIHNYIDTDERILRKGSIAAHAGEKVLIPINMRDGSVLAVGCGNPEWNYSAPHGAGRLLSRASARNTLSMEEYRETMKGIYTTSVNPDTLDEAPMAYKSLADILDVIRDSVDVIDVLKPVYNFKASSQE